MVLLCVCKGDCCNRLLPDRTKPPTPTGQRARSIRNQHLVEWNPVAKIEAGIAFYIIRSEAKEIDRGPFQYEQPSDFHSPLMKLPPQESYVDPNPNRREYDVLSVNGAGMTSEGKEAPPRRLGPARGQFFSKDGIIIPIKDFVSVKGKVIQVIDEAGNKYPLPKFGNGGSPNRIAFEMGQIVEAP